MADDLLTALDRSTAAEQIAQVLYQTIDASALPWDCAPMTVREEYRARARQAVRSCLSYAVEVGIKRMAVALAKADGKRWDELRMDDCARYRYRAQEAFSALQFHLAETAYPEQEERALAEQATRPMGKTLGERVDEAKVIAWRQP